MNFYTQQHEFYCGIDLHTTNMYACVVDQAGKKRLHRNYKTCQPEVFLAALTPFRKGDLVIGCESTFNWYWLIDGLMDAGYRCMHLANPSAMKQYEGIKHTDDQHDQDHSHAAR